MSISPEASRARTRKWIKTNGIDVPDKCELCGRTISEIQKRQKSNFRDKCKYFIVAHHWNGYEHPEDVWFVCHECNRALHSRHDGSLSKEEAKEFVKHGGCSPVEMFLTGDERKALCEFAWRGFGKVTS